VHPIHSFCGEEEGAKFSSVHAPDLLGEDPRPVDVLGRVGTNAAVNAPSVKAADR
jgi:hypothetical protein